MWLYPRIPAHTLPGWWYWGWYGYTAHQ